MTAAGMVQPPGTNWDTARHDVGEVLFETAANLLSTNPELTPENLEYDRPNHISEANQNHWIDPFADHPIMMAILETMRRVELRSREIPQTGTNQGRIRQREEVEVHNVDEEDDVQACSRIVASLPEAQRQQLITALSGTPVLNTTAGVLGGAPSSLLQPPFPIPPSGSAAPPHVPAPNGLGDTLIDAQRNQQTMEWATGLRVPIYIFQTGTQWIAAFNTYKLSLGTAAKSIALNEIVTQQANMAEQVLNSPLPPPLSDRDAWAPRYHALIAVADAFLRTYVSDDAAATFRAKVEAQWLEGRLFIHTAMAAAVRATPATIAPPTTVAQAPAASTSRPVTAGDLRAILQGMQRGGGGGGTNNGARGSRGGNARNGGRDNRDQRDYQDRERGNRRGRR